MTRVDLEDAERMLNEATPGPWVVDDDDLSTIWGGYGSVVVCEGTIDSAVDGSTCDRDLIVAAPTLIRALIEEVRGSKETIEQLTRERDEALVMLDARRKCQVIAEDEIERVRGERDEAHRRGMRDGFDLATEYDNNVRELGIDWTATENELDRRMSIPRASSAPSDKLSEEEL